MKKLYLPLLFDKESFVEKGDGGSVIPGAESMAAFYDKDKAQNYAKDLAMNNPKGKVVLFEAVMLIEPRRIEFAEKTYNSSGELVV